MAEEIIIDGVNVAGCENCYKEYDNWDGKDYIRCNDTCDGVCGGHNCYYKQLKRLEQENEAYKQSEQEAQEIIAELKQENEKLKENLRQLTQRLDNERADFEQFLRERIKDQESALKYKQALQEIKEVATLDDINCTISPEIMNVSKDVLKIINEVLDG